MKKKILLHILSICLLVIPNVVYLICNVGLLKEVHAVALTLVAIVVLSIVALGALLHFKAKAGIWVMIIGAFVLAMSNVSYVAGIALIIEGIALALDAYLIRPILVKIQIKELEESGKSVTYTRQID